MEYSKRPWGEYHVLEDENTHKVKNIKVKPKGRLSYQYHTKRSEVWTIISGEARVTIDDNVTNHFPGDVIKIGNGVKHRIENPSNDADCIFIEVQYGTYFGEDDIVRIADDYNRI